MTVISNIALAAELIALKSTIKDDPYFNLYKWCKTKNRHKVNGLGKPFGRRIFGPINIANGNVFLEIIFG